jgi:succinate dehydrogenase hydrophobic anchor subunit
MIRFSTSALPATADQHSERGQRQPFTRIGLWGWVGLYITGALLVFFLFAHIVLVHLKPSADITAQTTSLGLKSPFIKLLDLALLALAVSHGLLGARRIVLDCEIFKARGQAWLTGVLSMAGVLLVVFGWVLLKELTRFAG